jgi:demethylmenaquinone methyltransferase/2-methoxy-6-polyprenyl-1,4-benzoquinol methylase
MSGWAKKRKIMQRYDAAAHLYDMRYSEEQTAKIKAALESVRIKDHSSVLDVGCGTGILFQYVIRGAADIVGLDISRKNLIRAKERAKNSTNVHLLWADADNMPIKNNAFDNVFAVTLLQNMPNPRRTLNEIKRVSQADSIFVITGLKKSFSSKSFKTVLKEAGFEILSLMDEYNLKCYVAACANLHH